MSDQAPFPIHPHYTSIAIAYRNKSMIADDILPRIPVGKKQFKWLQHDLAEGFTVPDTKVGRKTPPNEIEFSATEQDSSTQDYALDDPIPQDDIDQAPDNYDPQARATEGVADLIELDREIRAASLLFNPVTYADDYKEALAGAAQWSDPTSNPIIKLTDILDGMIMRANKMVIGRRAFTRLATHPKIVKAMHGNEGDSGIATRAFIAGLLELDEIFVGEGRVNLAKRGQATNLQRVWGDHCALLYINPLADNQRGATFGYTAQFGDRVAGSNPDDKIGWRGGQRVRVGESVREVVAAKDLGYFIQNVIA